MKNEKKVFKGEVGYGTKKKAFDDMKVSNELFDLLDNKFINEEQFEYNSDIDLEWEDE